MCGVYTKAQKAHVPIRCRGQRDSFASHRLGKHLGRQHPPDRSIANPIRRRKQIHASEREGKKARPSADEILAKYNAGAQAICVET